jgi:2,4-dienoyl-CoA reductase-like NADH-dependent reductase (Old Yellow Enzyme family)
MTEGLADAQNRATSAHVRLYERWAAGGPGLLLTGNVQVDRRYLERAGNIAIEPGVSSEERALLQRLATAASNSGCTVWMQLSHAGRQTPLAVNAQPVAPSAVPLIIPGKNFGPPRALRAEEIEDVRERFVHAARVARECGFGGVQLHSAHGYLLSEFLSPRVNQRTDEWGGSLENRARLLLSIVKGIREQVGSQYPVSVKLNSSDFQRGGFTHEESLVVVRWLADAGVDLLEISGGTYEQPKMVGFGGILEAEFDRPIAESTRAREAYFLAHAAAIRKVGAVPLMVTGGFRTRAGMLSALAEGVDLIGIGRPLCTEPDLPARLLRAELDELPSHERSLRLGPGWLSASSPISLIKVINGFGVMGWYYEQLLRMGRGQEPNTKLSVGAAFIKWRLGEAAAARALRPPVH